MAARRKTADFETSLSQLEALVAALEGGELSLDEALRTFERGVGIARQCQQALRDAEQRVQQLTKTEAGEVIAEPFSEPGEADAP